MSYVSLALKYRPQRFDDLLGQEYVTTVLRNMIKTGRILPALIFSGPRGTGKTTTARILAKALNCEKPIDVEPCNKCESCKYWERSLQIEELDAASYGGVDDIRRIKEIANYGSEHGYKVWIIDEAHSLSRQAWEAFLKLLEEPPGKMVFIFCTTESRKIPDTIVSRSMTLVFQRQSIKSLFAKLKLICEKEAIEYDPNVLARIVDVAEGGVRDAIMLLEQLWILADLGRLTLEHVDGFLNRVPESLCFDLIEAVLQQDLSKVTESLDIVFSQVSDPMIVLNAMSEIYHSLFFVMNNLEVKDKSDVYLIRVKCLSKSIAIDGVRASIDILHSVKTLAVRANLSGRQIIEFAVIKLLPKTVKAQPTQLPQRVSGFELLMKSLEAEEMK